MPMHTCTFHLLNAQCNLLHVKPALNIIFLLQHSEHQQSPAADTEVAAELTIELKKLQNELRRKTAAVAVGDHEKTELIKRLTMSQESLLERDHSIEDLEQRNVELEVQVNQLKHEGSAMAEQMQTVQQVGALMLDGRLLVPAVDK